MTVVTPQQVADQLGIHINTVYSYAQRGIIPVAFHVGPRLRFDLDAVLQALKDAEQQPRTPAAQSTPPTSAAERRTPCR